MCYCDTNKECAFDDGLIGDYNNPCSHFNNCSHNPDYEFEKYKEWCIRKGVTPVFDKKIESNHKALFLKESSNELPF